MTRSITILGSTGSVGRSTVALLDAADPGTFRVEALVAHRDVAGLAIHLRRQGRHGEALKAWKNLFGPMFPLS